MLRLRVPGAVIDAKWLELVSYICNTWGNGSFHLGMRQTLNVPGIKAENIPAVNEYISSLPGRNRTRYVRREDGHLQRLPFIGPRNIMACIGGIHCIKGNVNTQEMAHKIEKLVYPNPYHIKVSIAGLPQRLRQRAFPGFRHYRSHKADLRYRPVYYRGACVDKCKGAATRVLSLNDKGKVDKDPLPLCRPRRMRHRLSRRCMETAGQRLL